MARYVPLSARRDLKPPAFLHLDPAERFPRVSVRKARMARTGSSGRSATAAPPRRPGTSLHKLFPLRPCDYTFEPDPALPLGLGCLFAQVRTCAAPCLVRIAEADYRALAAQVAEVLARPERRPQDLGLAPWVSAAGGRGVVVARNAAGVDELYPVRAGRVLDEAVILAPAEAIGRRDRVDPLGRAARPGERRRRIGPGSPPGCTVPPAAARGFRARNADEASS